MKFKPYYDKIEVKPLKKELMLTTPDQNLEEMGEVITVGERVLFVKPGDIVYFNAWGCSKTPEIDGEQHYLVPDHSDFILGKEEKDVAEE